MRPVSNLSVRELERLKQRVGDEGRAYIDVILRKKLQRFWADEPTRHVIPITPRAEPRTWDRKHLRTQLTKGRQYAAYLKRLRAELRERGVEVGEHDTVRATLCVPVKRTAHQGVKERMVGTPAVGARVDRPESYVRALAKALGCREDQITASLLWDYEGSITLEVV